MENCAVKKLNMVAHTPILMAQPKPCAHCGEDFTPRPGEQDTAKYCGRDCFFAHRSETHTPKRVELTCETCGDTYEKPPSQAKRSKYCSRDCLYDGQKNRVEKTCQNCGDEFEVSASHKDRKYCSKPCYFDAGRGGTTVPTCERCGEERAPGSKSGLCRECWRIDKRERQGKTVYCPNCGDLLAHNQEKYCSQPCYGEDNRKHPKTTECEVCGAEVDQGRRKGGRLTKTCSKECYSTYQSERMGPPETRTCEECGDEFEAKPSSDQRFCNPECAHENKRLDREDRDCPICGETFNTVVDGAHEKTWCSRTCFQKHRAATQGAKDKRCDDGHVVRSHGERLIDDWFTQNRIFHQHDTKHDPTGYKPDWIVYRGDEPVFVEFWGIEDNDDYDARAEQKREAYADAGVRLVEVWPEDLDDLDKALKTFKET